MQRILISLLLWMGISNGLIAQTPNRTPLSVGLIGDWGIQPGISIRAKLALKQLEQPNQTIFLAPQLAYFTQFGVHHNGVAGLDIGHYLPTSNQPHYWAYTGGIQYQFRYFLASQRVDLGTGDVPEAVRKSESYLVPNLGVEYGGRLSDRLGWYTRLIGGYRYGFVQSDEVLLRIEAGLTYWLSS